MKLKLKNLDKAVKPVLINEYLDEDGRVKRTEPLFSFKVYSTEENKKRDKKGLSINQTLTEGVIGWSNFKDDDDNDVVFSKEYLAELLEYQAIQSAIWKRYIECQTGFNYEKN